MATVVSLICNPRFDDHWLFSSVPRADSSIAGIERVVASGSLIMSCWRKMQPRGLSRHHSSKSLFRHHPSHKAHDEIKLLSGFPSVYYLTLAGKAQRLPTVVRLILKTRFDNYCILFQCSAS